MKPFWMACAVAAVVGAAALFPALPGCGPQKKFCPQIPSGMCPEPRPDTGVDMGMMDDGGAIFIDIGTSSSDDDPDAGS